MTKKQLHKQQLIDKYDAWKNFEKCATSRLEEALARDNMRAIKKIFFKKYKEDVEKHLTNN